MGKTNEEMRVYMAERRLGRRQKLLDMSGNRCVRCGSTECLEFNHLDRETKLFRLSGKDLDRSWEIILEEWAKCELLCSSCHKKYTSNQMGVPHGGGVQGKRGCSCAPCKARRAQYMKEYGHPNRVRTS